MERILLVPFVLAIFVGVVICLDRWTRTNGALFTGAPTARMKAVAFLLSIVFGGFFLLVYRATGMIDFKFALLACATTAYGLGATSFLRELQGRGRSQ